MDTDISIKKCTHNDKLNVYKWYEDYCTVSETALTGEFAHLIRKEKKTLAVS